MEALVLSTALLIVDWGQTREIAATEFWVVLRNHNLEIKMNWRF